MVSAALAIQMSSCIVIENQYTALAPGIWRAQFKLEQTIPAAEYDRDDVIVEIEEVNLPVLFEVRYVEDNKMQIIWQNGEEKIISDSISWGRDKATGKDSIRIDFPLFDTHISAWYEERVIEGYWEVHYKDNYRIPFVAFYGQGDRFKTYGHAPDADISGKWECTFEPGTAGVYPAVAEFQQNGNQLTGTFLTETGDFRFLEGVIEKDKFQLSCFDGSHAFLFEGKLTSGDSLVGNFRSGKHYNVIWTGVRNPEASLNDPLQINKVVLDAPVIFEGLDTEGKSRSTGEIDFTGKAKIIQVMGTWCPNCKDETVFLKEYIQANPQIAAQLDIVALAFEAYADQDRNLEAIRRYEQKMDLTYPIWLAGNKDKGQASQVINVIDRVSSYPTLLFVDKTDRVRYVHTGFSGPATSEYDAFKSEFDSLLNSLINF